MRTITTSGGLELGATGRPPWIDIIPLDLSPRNAVTLAAVEIAVRQESGFWSLGKISSVTLADAKGIAGIYQESGFAIRLLPTKGQSAINALREVERIEGGLPGGLVGALYAAIHAPVGATPRALTAARMLAAMTQVGGAWGVSSMKSEAIRQAAKDMLFSSGRGELPDGAIDRAAMFCTAADILWKPGAASANATAGATGVALGILAALRYQMDPPLTAVQAGQVKIKIPGGQWNPAAEWAQYAEWDAGDIPAAAIQHLHSGLWPSGDATIDRWFHTEDDIPAIPDPNLAHRVASALLDQAYRDAVYTVSGQFILSLPDSYPLRAWGISGLRVYATPDCLWVAVIDNHGRTGVSFQWTPRWTLRSFVVSPLAEPLLAATLAALWRDLRIAGEEAVPRTGDRKAQRAAPAQHTSSKQRRVVLPRRQQATAITGNRQWGSNADREIIRCSHGVRGHLRHLHRGWEASENAATIADEFGVVLPNGYTFVRPHTRGQGAATEHRETIVVARGLNSVMSLL